jgi:hypothetical protein
MRARCRFQPMLDFMPSRIALSAVVAVPAILAAGGSTATTVVASPDDSDPPEMGDPTPIIIAPNQSPTTLVC